MGSGFRPALDFWCSGFQGVRFGGSGLGFSVLGVRGMDKKCEKKNTFLDETLLDDFFGGWNCRWVKLSLDETVVG